MKAQLFVLAGRDVGRSFDIGERAVLGRGPECEVRLHDRSISRKHARVRRLGQRWVVEDLDSRNGLLFRDERVREAELQDHDEFVLGDLPIRFRLSELEPSQAAPAVVREDEPEDLIELEEEIVLEAEGETVAPRREPAPPGPRRSVPVDVDVGPGTPEVPDYERRRARVLRESGGAGFLRGDLSQRPFWFKALVGILLTGMAFFFSYLVYGLVQTLRDSS